MRRSTEVIVCKKGTNHCYREMSQGSLVGHLFFRSEIMIHLISWHDFSDVPHVPYLINRTVACRLIVLHAVIIRPMKLEGTSTYEAQGTRMIT